MGIIVNSIQIDMLLKIIPNPNDISFIINAALRSIILLRIVTLIKFVYIYNFSLPWLSYQ